jgi:hypothetical protein
VLQRCIKLHVVQVKQKRKPRLRGFCRALSRTRTVDPLLTMEVEVFSGGFEESRFPPCFSWIYAPLWLSSS